MVLGFACLWFGMLVPIHQRGQIQLPGSSSSSSSATAEATSHCSRPDAPCHRKAHDGKQPPGKPTNPENCAVCHFILGLHVPPPVTWCVERLGLVEVLTVERQAGMAHSATILPFHCRAPPVV
jgi:hypothetical protein